MGNLSKCDPLGNFGPLRSAVTAPRYVPNKYCRPSDDFGKKLHLDWRSERGMSASECDQLNGAIMHHVIAYSARRAMTMTAIDLADEMGLTESRLGRLLRGDIVMRLEDVVSFRRHLALSLTSVDEMLEAVDDRRFSESSHEGSIPSMPRQAAERT
jgi:hypothetical protein